MRNEQINNTAPPEVVSMQPADDLFCSPGLDRRFSFYRAVNERIREVTTAFAVFADNFEVFCECGARSCLERVDVPAKVYEDVLSGPRCLVKAGHESPDHGVVVAESGSYLVIEETSPYAHGKQREDWFESSASYDLKGRSHHGNNGSN